MRDVINEKKPLLFNEINQEGKYSYERKEDHLIGQSSYENCPKYEEEDNKPEEYNLELI